MVDHIPERDIEAARQALERLARDASFRAALSASADDEPVTIGDATAIGRAWADVKAGRVSSHDELLREFGIG